MTRTAFDGPHLVVDVWSDVACPWCYLGGALLDRALEQFPPGAHVDVRYHSYQLMPRLPADKPTDMTAILRERGYPPEALAASHAQLTARGKEAGLDYHFDKVVGINTRAAHRLSHFAEQHGKQHVLMRRLFKAMFTDGLNVGDHDLLADLAAEVGVDRAAARDALASGAFDEEVAADARQARELGLSGVPFFVLDRKYSLSGAQPVSAVVKALERAWMAKSGG